MSVICRIVFLSLLSLAIATDYYCENNAIDDGFCLINSIEVSSQNPVCRMQFPNHSQIQIQFSHLDYLSPAMLYRLASVERLDISHSYIGKAYVKAELQYLKISSSRLSELQIDQNEDHQLIELHLPSNALTRLPRNLNHLKNLTILDLSDNHLDYVDMTSFDGLSDLLTLQLNNNRIKVVFATGAVLLKALTYLSLSSNNISLLDISHWETPLLENLYLANNELEQLNGFPEKFTKLTEISLSDNLWNCEWQLRTRKALQERQLTYEWFDCRQPDQDTTVISAKALRQEQSLKDSMRSFLGKLVSNATEGAFVEVEDIVEELFCRLYGEKKD